MDEEERIGSYILLALLGQGVFAKVHLAVDELHAEKIVALKELPVGTDASARGRLLQADPELAILKRIRQQNIVRVDEVIHDEESERIFLVLEYADRGHIGTCCDGGEVSVLIGPDKIRDFMYQAATGLDYLHRCGILHRNITPESILWTSTGECKLGGFGANVCPAPYLPMLFWAPECVDRVREHTAAADVWALGIVLFAMNFRYVPFWSRVPTELLDKISNDNVQFPRTCPADLRDLLDRMLEKNPARRITIADVLLHDYFRNPTPAAPVATETPSSTSETIIDEAPMTAHQVTAVTPAVVTTPSVPSTPHIL